MSRPLQTRPHAPRCRGTTSACGWLATAARDRRAAGARTGPHGRRGRRRRRPDRPRRRPPPGRARAVVAHRAARRPARRARRLGPQLRLRRRHRLLHHRHGPRRRPSATSACPAPASRLAPAPGRRPTASTAPGTTPAGSTPPPATPASPTWRPWRTGSTPGARPTTTSTGTPWSAPPAPASTVGASACPGRPLVQPAALVRGLASALPGAGGALRALAGPRARPARAGRRLAGANCERAAVTAPRVILAVNGYTPGLGVLGRQVFPLITFGSFTRRLDRRRARDPRRRAGVGPARPGPDGVEPAAHPRRAPPGAQHAPLLARTSRRRPPCASGPAAAHRRALARRWPALFGSRLRQERSSSRPPGPA